MKIDYLGSSTIPTYGSGVEKNHTLAKYKLKDSDNATKQEVLQQIKDIRAKHDDAGVIVEISGKGLAALVNGKKGELIPAQDPDAVAVKSAAFQQDIVQVDKKVVLPEYSGLFDADKAIATALENCGKLEQKYVYDIIGQNFLLQNKGEMTEDDRLANINDGLKKADYAVNNYIPEAHKQTFLKAMSDIAKLAQGGKADDHGNMNYGITKGRYLGHGSNLVQTTTALETMQTKDKDAFAKYQSLQQNDDGGLSALKHLTNWYSANRS